MAIDRKVSVGELSQAQLNNAYGELQLENEKLKKESYLLKILIDNLPDSIYTKDLQGRKTFTNRVDMDIMGLTHVSDALGKTDLEIFPDDNAKQGYADDVFVMDSGKAIFNREECFRNEKGEERWVLTSKVPMLNESGEMIGLLGIGRCISERKRIEEALRLSNERFLYVTKATFDAIWDWDIENGYLYWGEGYEKIFGYSTSDHTSNQIRSFDNIHLDDRKRVFDSIESVIQGKKSNWSAEYRYQKADGSFAYVQDKGFLIRNEEGKAVRMIGAMQDKTEQKLAEEAIRQKELELFDKNKQLKKLSRHLQHVREEERKHLAREVHDELGQLASVIKMHIDWIKLRIPDLSDGFANRITHASSTAELMISSIRKIASDLRPLMLDELGLIASLKWNCGKFTHENGLPCFFKGSVDESLFSERQKTELFRICQESLTNVIRHSRATQVEMELTEEPEMIVLRIKDNGIGFSMEERKNTLGLVGMQERALSVEGVLQINSEKGKGTEIKVFVPKSK